MIQDTPATNRIRTVYETRGIYHGIYNCRTRREHVYQAWRGQALVMWMPTERAALANLLSLLQYIRTNQQNRYLDPDRFVTIHMLGTLDNGSKAEVEQVLELWWCPMNGNEWVSFLCAREYWKEPLRGVFTGFDSPAHHTKNVIVYTITTRNVALASQSYCSTHNWIPAANPIMDEIHMMVADMPATARPYAEDFVAGIQVYGYIGPDGPTISLATNKRYLL